MDEQKNNIRVLFTIKANSALDEIIKSFNLAETEEESIKRNDEGKPSRIVLIDQLSKDFSIGKISEKDLITSLQKDLDIPQQKAEQVSKEIMVKIVPFLEKVPEEKFKDPAFVEEISKKIFGEPMQQIKTGPIEKKDENIFPKIKPSSNIPESVTENPGQTQQKTANRTPTPKRLERIKKPIPIIEKPNPKADQSRGPDSYREPIG